MRSLRASDTSTVVLNDLQAEFGTAAVIEDSTAAFSKVFTCSEK
jgi:hypothetical protein